MRTTASRVRPGMTLMELVVVMAILALLAAISIPKLTDLVERSRSATQAYSTADVSRSVEIYFAMNKKYPDGMDNLTTEATGTIYTNLPAPLLASGFLTTTTLDTDQITSLNSAGIGHVFQHDGALTGTATSNSGTFRHHLGTGNGHDGTPNISTFVTIDSSGAKGLDVLINGFGLNPNRSASDTSYPRISANRYVVLGLGPKCTLVQTQIQEAPILEHSTSNTKYSRALLVFEVPLTGGAKAELVGVLGPDGRYKSLAIQDYNNINGVQPH